MSLVGDGVAERFSPDEARAAAGDFDLKRVPADFPRNIRETLG